MASLSDVTTEVAQDEEIVDVPIFKKDGTPYLGANGEQSTIGVVGSDAQAYRDVQRAVTKETQKLIFSGQAKRGEMDSESNRIRLASAGVRRWTGWEVGDAKDAPVLPCTPDNVKAMLRAPHVLKQVEEGIDAHASFFTKPSPR